MLIQVKQIDVLIVTVIVTTRWMVNSTLDVGVYRASFWQSAQCNNRLTEELRLTSSVQYECAKLVIYRNRFEPAKEALAEK